MDLKGYNRVYLVNVWNLIVNFSMTYGQYFLFEKRWLPAPMMAVSIDDKEYSDSADNRRTQLEDESVGKYL